MKNLRGIWAVVLAVSTGGLVLASAGSGPLNDTLTARQGAQSARIRTVVIDAGHGGRDLGCLGAHTEEKELALNMALGLGGALQSRRSDVRVVYTRDTDVFVPLHQRARIANRAQADLFISIHCNSLPSAPRAHGSETYVMGLHTAERNLNVAKRENASIRLEADTESNYDFDPDSPTGHIILSMFQHAFLEQSVELAQSLETALGQREGRRSRGVLQAGFVVLKETAMPSVLVETGYLSNRSEENYLGGNQGADATVEALYEGLVNYLRTLDAREGKRRVAAELPTRTHPEQVVQQRQASSPQLAPSASGVTYYVQLAASRTKLRTDDARWGELRTRVRHIREAGSHKYQYGPSTDVAQAQELLKDARAAGFDDAWIVAYQGGRRLGREAAGLE